MGKGVLKSHEPKDWVNVMNVGRMEPGGLVGFGC